MLAPVSERTRSGYSSFNILGAYITRRGREHVAGEAIPESDIVLSPALQEAGIEDAAVAARFMTTTASISVRVKDPVYHFQVTWQEGEQPTATQWRVAAGHALKGLGMEGHEYILAAHRDTENFHVHVMVNRIHPHRFVAGTVFNSHVTLAKAMREVEQEQGWKEDNGIYRWDPERNAPVRNTRAELEALKRGTAPRTRGAGALESFQDKESVQRFAQGEPARAVATYLSSAEPTWEGLHGTLDAYGLSLHVAEKGGYTVAALESSIHVKASDVFRATFAGKANREAWTTKLGPWRPMERSGSQLRAERSLEQIARPVSVEPARKPREYNAGRRAAQAEARKADRKELRLAFQAERKGSRDAAKAVTAGAREERRKVYANLKAERFQIRTSWMSPAEKKAARSTATAQSVIALRAITAAAAETRRHTAGTETYELWVARKAEEGNMAAMAQLRGWRYQDARNLEKARREIAAQSEAVHLGPMGKRDSLRWHHLQHQKLQQSSAFASAFQKIAWTIERSTGNVTYTVAGAASVVDRGRTLSVASDDERAILFGLELARAKYGRELKIDGNADWQARVARVAVRHNIDVSFSSPAAQQTMLEERSKVERAAAAPPVVVQPIEPSREELDRQLKEIAKRKTGSANAKIQSLDGVSRRTITGRIMGYTEGGEEALFQRLNAGLYRLDMRGKARIGIGKQIDYDTKLQDVSRSRGR